MWLPALFEQAPGVSGEGMGGGAYGALPLWSVALEGAGESVQESSDGMEGGGERDRSKFEQTWVAE